MSKQLVSLPTEVVVCLQSTSSALRTHEAGTGNGQLVHTPLDDDDDDDGASNTAAHDDNQISRRSQRPKPLKNFKFSVRFWQQIWHLGASRSLSGWEFRLQTYKIRPDNAPIFDLARAGDLAGVRRSFASGKASPFDCNSEGTTLLELANRAQAVDVVRYLLDHIYYPDLVSITSTETFNDWRYYGRCNNFEPYFYGRLNVCTVDLLRASLEHDSCDPTDFYNDRDSFAFNLLYCFLQQRYFEEIVRSQPLPLSSIPMQSRLHAAVRGVTDASTPKGFLRICGLKSVTHELATIRSTEGWKALGGAIVAMRPRLDRGKSLQGWPDFAQSLLEHGAEYHQIYIQGRSTLMLEMLTSLEPTTSELEAVLERLALWIGILTAAGVDLLEYGRKESLLWQEFGVRTNCFYSYRHYDLLDFRYGPKAADWSLIVQAKEGVPLFIRESVPGAWEDDRIPRTIAWVPRYDDIDSEMWRAVDHILLCGEPQDIRLVVEEEAPSAVEQKVADTQDDHGIMNLMVLRSRTASGSRQRSASQPPPLRRRQRQYCFPQRVAHHSTWDAEYHLCPADGLHRFGCRKHKDVPRLTYSGDRFSLAHCVKAGCSRGVDDYNRGFAHPFSRMMA